MNRLFVTGLMLFVLALGAVGQAWAQVQLGVRGGGHWSTVSRPEALGGFSPTLRFSAGPTGALFLDVPLGERVSFRPELAYVQKGFLFREQTELNLGAINIPLGARIAYQTNTLQVPLLLKVNLSDGPVQPYLFAGPAVGYAVDGRARVRATAFFQTRPYNVDLDFGGALNPWDFSAVGGLGLAADLGAGKFFVEGRYDHGFTRQLQVPLVNVPVRNRGISASLGYSFPIGR